MTRKWVFDLRVHEQHDDFFLGYDYDNKGGRRGYATCEDVQALIEEWIGFSAASAQVIMRAMNNNNSGRYWDLDIIITELKSPFFESDISEEHLIKLIKDDLDQVGLTFDCVSSSGYEIDGNCTIVLKSFINDDSEPKEFIDPLV